MKLYVVTKNNFLEFYKVFQLFVNFLLRVVGYTQKKFTSLMDKAKILNATKITLTNNKQ